MALEDQEDRRGLGVCDGFIGNRMIEQYLRQAGFLLDEGCTRQVDKAIEKFGFAMGPFRMGDLAGNDIGWAIRKRRYVEQPNLRYSKTADLLCELGRFGQKTGAGWYDYQAGKRDADPVRWSTDDRQAPHRDGITPRKISDEEIVQRLVFPWSTKARILEEGIACGPGHRHGLPHRLRLPAARRGPMNYADTGGPVQRGAGAMKRFAKTRTTTRAFWQPAPLLPAGRRRPRRSPDERLSA